MVQPRGIRRSGAGTWGNAGRNLGRGPSLYQIDLGITRRIALNERVRLEIRAEAFNLLNRSQLGDPVGDVTVPSQFGVIQSTINTTPIGSGTPRQIQFMMRLCFERRGQVGSRPACIIYLGPVRRTIPEPCLLQP